MALLLKKDARRSISQGLGHLGPDDTQNASTLNNEMLQNQHDSNKSEANQHSYFILGIAQPMIPFSRRDEKTSNKQEQPGMQFTIRKSA
jgi:hypothetical protein